MMDESEKRDPRRASRMSSAIQARAGLFPGSVGGPVTAWYSLAGIHAVLATSRQVVGSARCTVILFKITQVLPCVVR